MKRQIVVKDSAVADLDALYFQGTERWGRVQAREYLEALDKLFNLLSEQPETAREREDVNPPVRIHPFRSHVVIYSVSATECDILRVPHTRSNWQALLSK